MSKLHEVDIHRLRPTQITVGMIDVHDKRDKLQALKSSEQREFLAAHPIPAVWGPEDKLYITDHHHLGRAASDAGIATGFFCVEEDFSKLALPEFWSLKSKRVELVTLNTSQRKARLWWNPKPRSPKVYS